MGSLVVVEGFTYTLSGVTEVSPGSGVVTTVPSSTLFIEGKGVYVNEIKITFAPQTLSSPLFSASNNLNTAPTTFTISASGISKTKHGGLSLISENDTGSASVTGDATNPSPPPDKISASVVATISIDNPGQESVYAS